VGRLDGDGETVLVSESPDLGDVVERFGCSRDRGYTGFGGSDAGSDLVAHRGDRFGRRADPDEAGLDHRSGEFSVLCEEPVPGMNGIGFRFAGNLQDPVDVQVGLG